MKIVSGLFFIGLLTSGFAKADKPKIDKVEKIERYSTMMGANDYKSCRQYSQAIGDKIKAYALAHKVLPEIFSITSSFSRPRIGYGRGNIYRWGICNLQLASTDSTYGFYYVNSRAHKGLGSGSKCQQDLKTLQTVEGVLDSEVDNGLLVSCQVEGLYLLKEGKIPL